MKSWTAQASQQRETRSSQSTPAPRSARPSLRLSPSQKRITSTRRDVSAPTTAGTRATTRARRILAETCTRLAASKRKSSSAECT
jgi:hypothetical protein